MDHYFTPGELAQFFHIPTGTVYRWASEDGITRRRINPGNRVVYRFEDFRTAYEKRHRDEQPAA
jgi:DNA-binding transcriptional MerR regulator